MANPDAIEKAIPLPGLAGRKQQTFRQKPAYINIYKVVLLAHDLAWAILIFNLVSRYAESALFNASELMWGFSIISLTVLSFFPTYNLYEYTHFFSRRTHLKILNKALFWGLLTLCTVLFLCMETGFFTKYFAAAILLMILGLLVAVKHLKNPLINLLKAAGVSCLLIGGFQFYDPGAFNMLGENGLVILAGFLTAAAILNLSRVVLVQYLFNHVLRRHFRRQVTIVGSNEEAKQIATRIIERNAPFWISGIVGVCGLDVAAPKACLGAMDDLPEIVRQNRIEEVIVTDETIDRKDLVSLLDFCTSHGLAVWFSPKLMPIIDIKLHLNQFCGLEMIRLCSQKQVWLFNKIKHAFDALITLPLMLALTPVFLLIAAAIKINSKGPVFYRARAVGKNGDLFGMFKFRSMVVNNDAHIHQNYVTRLINGDLKTTGKSTPLKITNDPRVTGVGRLLRKLSLDELPQLINVLKGNMSLVGPRPCLPYEYDIYKDWHKRRSSVRPGITGLWQVAGRSAVAFEDMILLDLYYIYNRSLVMDLLILWETLFVVLKRQGAY